MAKSSGTQMESETILIRLNELRYASNEVQELRAELRAAKQRVKAAQQALVEVNLGQRELPVDG